MKRTLTTAILTVLVGLSTARSTEACMYIPWLDPFAWLGFYGCGYGGCGYNPCGFGGCGYNYGVAPRVYAPQAPLYSAPQTLGYPAVPASPGCNCTSSLPTQPAMAAVRVPVTTYRAVTQYVPQTTYRTQYQPIQQSLAAGRYQPYYGGTGVALGRIPTIYGGYAAPRAALYAPTYSTATLPSPVYQGSAVLPPQIYSSPLPSSTGIASPLPGDIMGDHEYPSQSAVAPLPVNPVLKPQIRQASYGIPPTRARTFSAVVR